MATTPGRIRPWRYLAAFAGIVVVLYALVFFTGVIDTIIRPFYDALYDFVVGA